MDGRTDGQWRLLWTPTGKPGVQKKVDVAGKFDARWDHKLKLFLASLSPVYKLSIYCENFCLPIETNIEPL